MVGYSAVLLCTDFFIPLFGSVVRNSFGHELNHKSVGPLKNVKNHLWTAKEKHYSLSNLHLQNCEEKCEIGELFCAKEERFSVFWNENFSQEIVGNSREVKVSANPTAIIIVSYLQTVLRLVSVISLLPFTTTFLS